MHGGLGPNIVRRGRDSVAVAGSVNWVDIVEKLANGPRHSTQQILGTTRAIKLQLFERHPVAGDIAFNMTSLYYRVDAAQPTIASNFNPVTENWSVYSGEFVVNPGNWVTFGVAENVLDLPVTITIAVKNVVTNIAADVDTFDYTYYVAVGGGGGSSSSSGTSSASSSTSSTTTTSSASSAGGGGGGQPPPPEDP